MKVTVEIENLCPDAWVPTREEIEHWLAVAQAKIDLRSPASTLSLCFVDVEAAQALNNQYRGKDKATNVLSFPAEFEDSHKAVTAFNPLGDIAVCAPLVAAEAMEQGKELVAHWAHLLIHGLLHLHGFQHEEAAEATKMEAIETMILAELGFADPYQAGVAQTA